MKCCKVLKIRRSKKEEETVKPVTKDAEIVGGHCSIEEAALFNHEIIGRIFGFLDLDSLKSCRLVCHKWSIEAALKFHKVFLQIKRNKDIDKDLPMLTSFLTHNNIKHTLRLCFFSSTLGDFCYVRNFWDRVGYLVFFSWRSGYVQRRKLMDKYYAQKNKVSHVLTNYLKDTAYLVVEFRLELNLLKKGDGALMGNVVSQLKNLKRFTLDITNYEEDEVLNIPETCLPHSVETVGLRIHLVSDTNPRSLTLMAYVHLMNMFSQMKFFDMNMWEHDTMGPVEEVHCKVQYCKTAISSWMAEDEHFFPNFCGLKLNLEKDCELRALNNFPIPLRYLCIQRFYHWGDETKLERLVEILKWLKDSLELFDMFWIPMPDVVDLLDSQVDLPELSHIKYFGVTNSCHLQQTWGVCTLEVLDMFNLREIFIEGNLKLGEIMPKLTDLTVLLPYEDGEEIWEYIFPNETKDGEPLRIEQITYLSLSISGECYAPNIKRICDLFPNLEIFRHIIPQEEGGVVCCEHEFWFPERDEITPEIIIRSLSGVVQKEAHNPECITYAEKIHYYMKHKVLADAFVWR